MNLAVDIFQTISGASASDVIVELVNKNKESRPNCIEIGKYEVTTWYSSPYPQEFAR